MISASDYKYISDRISDNHESNYLIRDELFSIINNLSGITATTEFDFTPEILESEIADIAYLYIVQKRIDVSQYAVDLVEMLQKHVTTHYGSVNGFLDNYGIQVKQYFAELSTRAGYVINPGNIE